MERRNSRTEKLEMTSLEDGQWDNMTQIMKQISKFDNMMGFKGRTCELEIEWWGNETSRCKELLSEAKKLDSDYRMRKLIQLIKVAESMQKKVSKFRDVYNTSEREFHFENYGELHALSFIDRTY